MEHHELDELCKRKRDQSQLLGEVSDLTKQLADALNRRDEVSVRMLLSMREEPIRGMQEIESGMQDYLLTLPEPSAIRGAELLRGAEAQSGEESPLCSEVAKYRRMLASVLEQDKRMSLLLGGNRSFYNKFRE